jgi:catechol 2,3-dioxygenase
MATSVRGLAEVVIFVEDVGRSLVFYRDVLGLNVMAQPDARGAVFLQAGPASLECPQQIVLVPRPRDAPAPGSQRTQRVLHHIGVEIAAEDFERERTRLEQLGFDVRLGKHPFLPLRGMYIDDPDGNEVELIAAKR